MSLNSAMFSGVSGVMTLGNAMNVIGDNIANVNTVGYKGNRASFGDILSNSLSNGSTSMQIGRGTFMNNIQPSWAQGSFESTGNATDMGIQGSGFFVVQDTANNADYYTRAGSFILNDEGYLVNSDDYRVQGYKVTSSTNGTITTSSAASDILIDGVQATPRATTEFHFAVNLNASASAGTTFSTSFDVYNSLGENTTLTYTFSKDATTAQSWDYVVTASSGTVSTGSTGTVTFSSTGVLTAPATNQTVAITGYSSGAADLSMIWALNDTTTSAAYNEITGYASSSTTYSIVQDGYGTGSLRGLSVDTEGVISGLFSNGQTQELYQLVMADFQSEWGLTRVGGSLFAESATSGQPLLGKAGTGGFGTVMGSSLELSNVDLATEFVRMIQNQRGYQANARIITTVDDMLAEAVNLKR